ncbi:DUF2269 family protein [Parafrigoribacterium soli]|uniref:DUF2269 family protein n=1 Tax=Parafrigoribacterium soli TaxID=3144663 RepID=UPI0032EC18F7
METLFNVLHVVTAVFIVGPMAILPMTGLRAIRAGNGAQVKTLATSVFVFSLISLVVVVFGFGLLGMSDPKYHLSFGTTWIWLSTVAYLVALLLNLFLVVPALRKAGAEVAKDGSGKEARYPQIAAGSGVVSLLLLLVVVLMVWKP